MPADNANQPSQDNGTPDTGVEIITPLKVHGKKTSPGARRLKPSTAASILVLLTCLAAVLTGGLLFIRHMSNPAVPVAGGRDETASVSERQAGAKADAIDSAEPESPISPTVLPKALQTEPNAVDTARHRTDRKTASAAVQTKTLPKPVLKQRPGPAEIPAEKAIDSDRKKLNRLIASAKQHEQSDRLEFALADFRAALDVDPAAETARDGFNRVKAQITDRQFQQFMSDGLSAYHNGNYADGRAKLLQAKTLRPDSEAVQEALLQVDNAIRTDTIEILHHEADAAEQSENWPAALASYLTVLKLDPNVSFALEGKTRAIENIRLAKRVAFFLQRPEALASNLQLENALALIEAADRLPRKGPQFTARLNELKSLVETYQTPVEITINSDDLTDVVVYKVGRFGRFTVRKISLRPGKYTVVGTRDGYEDVRRHITVNPGQKALRITITCKRKV